MEVAGNSGSFLNGNAYLEVDMSEVTGMIDMMRGVMKKEKFEQLMYRTFKEVGGKSRTLIAREVTQDYEVPVNWAKRHIGNYRLQFGGAAPVTCTIPLRGAKGIIGGRFRTNSWRRGRRIVTHIVKGSTSTLPSVMRNQGGNPPFMVNGLAFTRRTAERKPIVRVAGLALPQMPMNRSAEDVQEQILNFTADRLVHNFNYMMGNGR